MTAAVTSAPPVRVPAGATTRALALSEGRLLLRSPMLWVGVVLAAVLCTAWGWTTQPDWPSFSTNAGMAAMILAGFLLLLGHQAASRDHRHGTTETVSALPTSARQRTIALLALVPVAGLAGALAFGAAVLGLAPAWPAGDFDPWLALITVTVPMTGAALGVAVGRWLPATAAGPLALFAAAAGLGALPIVGSGAGDLPWVLFPVVTEPPAAPGSPEPTGWHLLFLAAVLVAVGAAVPLRHRRALPAAVLVLALLVAGIAVRRQLDERAAAGPATPAVAAQQCERHDRVSYCALPGYGRWIPLWRAAVEPVVRAVPPAAGELPAVRQGTAASNVIASTSWGRHSPWAADSRNRLAREYVLLLLGMPAAAEAPAPTGPEPGCSGAGQLRTVVALWLVAQADPRGAVLRDAGRLSLGLVRFGPAETQAAARLHDAPRHRVTAVLAEHWAAIRSPAPVGDVLAPFGVTGLPPAGESPCP